MNDVHIPLKPQTISAIIIQHKPEQKHFFVHSVMTAVLRLRALQHIPRLSLNPALHGRAHLVCNWKKGEITDKLSRSFK